MKTAQRVFAAIATGAFSAFAGLLFELFAGVLAWSYFRGVPGVVFAMICGGVTAVLIRRSTKLPSSAIAGAIGAMTAAFFAIACGEVITPGTIEWALGGGIYGAMFGVPLGGILGLLGLLHPELKSEDSRQ